MKLPLQSLGVEYLIPMLFLFSAVAHGQTLDYESDIQPIFTENCTSRGCHISNNTGGGLNLESGNSYAEITGSGTTTHAPLVIAGSPDISQLIWKLEGVDNNGNNVFNSRMPLGGPFLSQSTIDIIRQWITQGAVLTGVEDEIALPEGFALSQNYPNPFNPVTTIDFTVGHDSFVKLTIFDVAGRKVDVLLNEYTNSGSYSIEWDASRFASGVYFYTFETEGTRSTRKLLLLK